MFSLLILKNCKLATASDYIPYHQHDRTEPILAIEPLTTSITTVQEEELVDMRVVNYELKYENIDGGVWKQGFDIHVEPVVVNDTIVRLHRQQQQQQQPPSFAATKDMLEIFVVPHSHTKTEYCYCIYAK